MKSMVIIKECRVVLPTFYPPLHTFADTYHYYYSFFKALLCLLSLLSLLFLEAARVHSASTSRGSTEWRSLEHVLTQLHRNS
jgi:hypothetical protein